MDIKDAVYYKYADDILNGKIVACRYIKLACKRFFDFLNRDDIEFREDKVKSVLNFCGKMIQFQEPFNDKPLVLSPFQEFFIANIYGFYYKDTDDRVCQHAILEVGRKAGKSALCAVLGLYSLICESDGQVEVDVAAMTRQQAKILFDMACEFAKKIDPRQKHLKPTINKLKFKKNNSYFQCLAAEANQLDGYSAKTFFLDEAAAQKDSKLYDVLASSQGSRKNPLSVILTSANYNLQGPHFLEWRKAAIDVLEGIIENDSLFAMIFTLDEGDDYRDEAVWQKANPNLGITPSMRYLRDRIIQAKSNPAMETDVKTKNFNMYVQSAETWIPDNYIMSSFQKIELDKLKGELCYGGLDLASVSDMTAFSLMFPPNKQRDYYPDKYIFYSRAYLPEDALVNSVNAQFYQKCKKAGHLFTTPGNVTDYDYILNDLIKFSEEFYIENIAYDAYNSTQFIIAAQEEGLPCEPFAQGLGSFNRPTKELERLILSDNVVIDGSVITRWCFQNVAIKQDHNENSKPVKQNKQEKIDIVICMLEALGIYLLAPNYVYSLDETEE